jgi:hypothetical protein
VTETTLSDAARNASHLQKPDPAQQKRLKTNWNKVLEETWGRALVHESGHALMAVLQEIPCDGICFDKTANKFCTLAHLPPSEQYSPEHYLFLTAGSAAERIVYGNQDEDAAKSDRKGFSSPTAPPVGLTVDGAYEILSKKGRQLKRLVSLSKEKCRQADFNLGALPERVMEGSDRKYGILISKEELEDAVQRK